MWRFQIVFVAFAMGLPLSQQAAPSPTSDWPQILGPQRNGIYLGPDLAAEWPAEGPKRLWRKRLGEGFAGPVAQGDRVYVFHREGQEEVLECLKASTGDVIWKSAYETGYRDGFGFDNGPRAVPTLSGDAIVTYGAEGCLTVRNLSNGSEIWQRRLDKDLDSPAGFFGRAGSPLVAGGLVILNPGGKDGAGIVAYHLKTGKLAWKATDEEASYSSPLIWEGEANSVCLVFARSGLVGLHPATGRILYQFPWRAGYEASVNAANPLVLTDSRVFLSASYETGAVLLDLSGNTPREIWSNDDSLSNQYATSVHDGKVLYGLHGRHDSGAGTELRCVRIEDGEVLWQQGGWHPANLIRAGRDLLILTEGGELIRVRAHSLALEVLSHHQILGTGTRAHPALAQGRWFGRDPRQLIALQLAPSGTSGE